MKLLTQTAVSKLTGIDRHTVGEWFRKEQITVVVMPGMKRKMTTLEAVQALIVSSVTATARPQIGPSEVSRPHQSPAKRTNSNRAEKTSKNAPHQWRRAFR